MSYSKIMLMVFPPFAFFFSFFLSFILRYKKILDRPRSLILNFVRVLLVFSLFQTSHAATFTVLNTNDTGPDSLRFALFLANTNSEDDTILFDPSLAHATITLTSGEIVIGTASPPSGSSVYSTTIIGPVAGKANSIVIDASGNSRVFNVQSNSASNPVLTLENLTLTGGNVVGRGGAIASSYTSLTLNHVVLTGNAATGSFPDGYGGGISIEDADYINLNDCVLSNNSGNEVSVLRVWSDTNVIITDSLITGNTSTRVALQLYQCLHHIHPPLYGKSIIRLSQIMMG